MTPFPVHPLQLVAPLPSTPELARLMETPVGPVSCCGFADAVIHHFGGAGAWGQGGG
jgi:hypothetical protein